MSIDASRWAWTQQITPSQKIVLLSLADRADEEGYCYPSVKRLELDCSMTRRTIQRNLSELEALNLIERKSRFTESGQTSNDFFLIGIVDRHAENTPKINRSGRRKPIKSIDSNHVTSDTPPAPPVTPPRATSDTPPAPPVTPPRATSDTPPAPPVTPRINKKQSFNQKTNNNTLDPQTAAPITPSLAIGLTERQKEEALEKLAQLSPEQQIIAIQSFNKAVEGNTAKSPAALMNRLINLGLKNGLEATQTVKPMQTPTQTPKKPVITDKERENTRLEIMKVFVANKKPDLLKEFAERGYVSSRALGTIIEPDLRLAGLFD